jgi:hypothetical protein
MDDYPNGSLNPSIPLLLTLGVAAGSDHGTELDAALKEYGVLVRSEVAPLDTEQALGLLRYIQEHDASRLAKTGPDGTTSTRYRFRVRTAERVRKAVPPSVSPCCLVLIGASLVSAATSPTCAPS